MSRGSPLRQRDFRLLLAGQTTSQLGTQISGVAVPLLAAVTLHATPLQFGLIGAAGTVSFALIGLPAGAWVDRWPSRPVLVASDLVRAVLLASVPVAALLGALSITQLIVVALLTGVARVFFDVAYPSYVPAVVGRDRLLAGNSAMETLRAGGQAVGPGVGGWLVTVAGAANVVLIQAVTFALSAVSLLAIRAGSGPRVVAARPPRSRLRSEIRDGLVLVLRDPFLRATALTSAAGNFAFAVASSVSMLFMVRTVGLSPAGVGIALALGSLTVIVGAAATPKLAARVGSARIIWVSLAVTSPLGLLSAAAGPGWRTVLLVVGIAAGELGQIVYAITNVSMRQRLCPEHILGRVTATMRFLMMGLFPVGALLGGVLGEVVGLRATLWLSGGIIVASTLPVYLALRHLRDAEDLSPRP